MTMKHAAIAAAVAAAAVLALPNGGAVAKGPGMASGPGMHPFHFKSHFLSDHHHRFAHRHNNNNALGWPLYGGYYAIPPYDDVAGGEPGGSAVVIVQGYQLPRLTCEKNRETITVPSESGGTREITVTRC